jgi:hypothetical protein
MAKSFCITWARVARLSNSPTVVSEVISNRPRVTRMLFGRALKARLRKSGGSAIFSGTVLGAGAASSRRCRNASSTEGASIIAVRNSSSEERSMKCAEPTGCTSPMAFISDCAETRLTSNSRSISDRPYVSVRAWVARSRIAWRSRDHFTGRAIKLRITAALRRGDYRHTCQ